MRVWRTGELVLSHRMEGWRLASTTSQHAGPRQIRSSREVFWSVLCRGVIKMLQSAGCGGEGGMAGGDRSLSQRWRRGANIALAKKGIGCSLLSVFFHSDPAQSSCGARQARVVLRPNSRFVGGRRRDAEGLAAVWLDARGGRPPHCSEAVGKARVMISTQARKSVKRCHTERSFI